MESEKFDFVVIGAGSAGCAVAARLAEANLGTVAIIEAGKSDRVPQVKVPADVTSCMPWGRLPLL